MNCTGNKIQRHIFERSSSSADIAQAGPGLSTKYPNIEVIPFLKAIIKKIKLQSNEQHIQSAFGIHEE